MDCGQIIDSTCLDGHPSFYRLCSATIVMSDRLISGGTRSILIWILWIFSEIPEISQKSQLTQLIDGTHRTISRVSTIPSGLNLMISRSQKPVIDGLPHDLPSVNLT